MKLTHDQKEAIIKAIWVNGTLEAGAEATKLTIEAIHTEMKQSAIFKKRIRKALEESKGMLIDEARALVRDYMRGKHIKTDRNRLTAAIALLNAYEPGFRGTVQGRVEHVFPQIKTAVPRPRYDEIESPLMREQMEYDKQEKAKLKVIDITPSLLPGGK